ncbi:outer membrane lipoprotein carrier protein LolA [Rheinheimera sp.]|uniref:outer membrane lipoprotein carrier protein LolA n=1 Tax=Rheinheimera sp. TaxID=1869214 RepID=UPI0040480C5B
MIRLGLVLLLTLLLMPAQATDSQALLRFTPLQGQLNFSQSKQLQGLPVALKSSGYIQLQAGQLLWHTTAPVDSKLLVSPAGVSQWQQQQYVAVAGSEFVGQLMLAVLQQQHQFIQAHFALSDADNHCQLLQPLQAPLSNLFVQIRLCGETTLQQIVLQESNGNSTTIDLQPGANLD